ncbi:GNAT family N-acetyltransferase [Baaleninema sp.]|uniref:GNAT family N-acetyltransferase n=1 Tax=Baaleninema sp. TaxID=3101197 RepID=UPI003D0289D4
MKIEIRQETPKDFDQIYNLVKMAFQTAKVSNGQEQDFVNQLRHSDNYIPELALVAECDRQLVGHIMLTRNYINPGRKKNQTLLLAPISVMLEYRNRGIGTQLIRSSFKQAKNMGYRSVVLVGDPAYYHRFGFKKAADFGITHMQDIPEEYVLACELVPNGLDGVRGAIDC